MATQSENTPRILTRGQIETFREKFFEDEAQTTPLVPIDANSYPAFSIYDSNNELILSGVGQLDGAAGNYKAEFSVPQDAVLTVDEKRYRIEWVFVTNSNRQHEAVHEFDVRDVIITASESRELQYTCLAGKEFMIFQRLAVRPEQIKVSIFLTGTDSNPVVSEKTLSAGEIKETVDGDSYVYSYTIEEGITLANTCYTAIWEIKDEPTSVATYEFQIIIALGASIMPLMKSLRMLIDKFQKRIGRVQAYEDSDLVEYISQGTRMVNAGYPTTAFTVHSAPPDIQVFILLMAGWWALNAQHLLEVDLGFDFSGQSVTLSYDHTSGLSEALGRWSDYVEKNLPAAKMSYLRKNTPVGTVSGRPMRYNALHNYVYKISSVGAGDFMTMLTKIGIL